MKRLGSGSDSDGDSVASDNDRESGSFHDDPSTTKGSGTSAKNSDESTSTIKEQISKQESQDVFRLRMLVVVVLVLTAAAISCTVYWLTSDGESDAFKAQYEGAADKITTSFEGIMHKMGSVSALGVAYTAYSANVGSSWPFVTLPNLQERAGSARHMSGALFVGISPVVTREHFDAWDEYIMGSSNNWIDEANAYQERLGVNGFGPSGNYHTTRVTDRKVDLMHGFDSEGYAHREESPDGPYFPLWGTSPYMNASGLVNHNIIYRPNVSTLVANVMTTQSAYFGGILRAPAGDSSDPNPRTALFATLLSINEKRAVRYNGEPFVELYVPIFDVLDEEDRRVVAILTTLLEWKVYLQDILPNNSPAIEVVIDYECAGEYNLVADTDRNGEDSGFTFVVKGREANFLGYGDQHRGFDELVKQGNLITDNIDDGTVLGIDVDDQCSYDIHVYPTQEFYDYYSTSNPMVITWSIVAVFLFTIFVFLWYNHIVERRQTVVLKQATQATAVVASLFPKNVRTRVMETDGNGHLGLATKSRLRGFLINGDQHESSSTAAPIADLYPHCTVFFGDICGFTAWSSTREPAQVFLLLQSLYQAFDVLAKRRRVFKVETIGDCYMAVTGLPEPQQNHATIMVRFAWECLIEVSKVTKKLECTLGPDTAELNLRIGLHSGTVTAGVLKGDRARFQLFGDTVNTASRMETTGRSGKIQVTEATANILKETGKEHWLKPREDMVLVKGKGVMQAYWANLSSHRGTSAPGDESSETKSAASSDTPIVAANERLVEWVVDLFVQDMKKLMYARMRVEARPNNDLMVYHPPKGKTCLDEAQDIVRMPEYDAKTAACRDNHDGIIVDVAVMKQLRTFVAEIAGRYRKNSFHNFEHACHVVMSSRKLLTRVVTPELSEEQLERLKQKKHRGDVACHIHECCYGISSEPLALLAVTFSSLIHDVDHRGVSNMQMMIEEPEMGERYQGKSIAEQNSLDIAWSLFMEDRFVNLRQSIFASQADLMQFRQLIVNIVLATDIFDKDLNGLRRSRWEQAFADHEDFDTDTRATIVLEHIIQASDVSHTMQHWQVYQKWNKKLFKEMMLAFKTGRLEKDPKSFWYRGEIGFFDSYIIPLAKKLKQCGVFGVSSDEYLNYAMQNRAEWAARGEDLLQGMVEEMELEALDSKLLGPPASTSDSALFCQPTHPTTCECCIDGETKPM